MLKELSNVATWDRVVRIILGTAMLFLGWSGLVNGVWAIALVVFAWVPLLTGLVGWCPIYTLMGISTRRRRPVTKNP